jgi:hypothetical protein
MVLDPRTSLAITLFVLIQPENQSCVFRLQSSGPVLTDENVTFLCPGA